MPQKPFVIAEMACSHEGDTARARRIIAAAGEAGADAIQFQIWKLDTYAVRHHPDYANLKRLELSREAWKELATFSREQFPQMEIIACVSEPGGLGIANEISADAYKIHAGDITHSALLEKVGATGKRVDLSVGACRLGEIEQALRILKPTSSESIWLMYGFQLFPTDVAALDISRMTRLAATFGHPVGYQDHSAGESDAAFHLPAATLGMGVLIQEKHLTDDRSRRGTDHEAALEPKEFRRFVSMCRELGTALAAPARNELSPAEERYRTYASRTLVAARPLEPGSRLSPGDLLAMRTPNLGLTPDREAFVMKKTLKRPLAAYDSVTEEILS